MSTFSKVALTSLNKHVNSGQSKTIFLPESLNKCLLVTYIFWLSYNRNVVGKLKILVQLLYVNTFIFNVLSPRGREQMWTVRFRVGILVNLKIAGAEGKKSMSTEFLHSSTEYFPLLCHFLICLFLICLITEMWETWKQSSN